MPSFLVDSLKKDGLYVSNGSHDHQILSAAAAVVMNTGVKNTLDEESIALNSSYHSEPSEDLKDTKVAAENCTLSKSGAFSELQRDNIIDNSRQDSEPKEAVRVTNAQMNDPPPARKVAEKKDEMKLLPPAAFLLKKDGSPFVGGSSVLPNVFRTHSELLQGQATLNENHFMPISGTDTATSALAPPVNFGGRGLQQYIGSGAYQFVSPAEEMVYIRNALQDFKRLKEKLRRVAVQEKQLSSWLADQPADSQDSDVIVIRQELKQVQDELTELSTRVKLQKNLAQKLTARVQQLLPTLSPKQ